MRIGSILALPIIVLALSKDAKGEEANLNCPSENRPNASEVNTDTTKKSPLQYFHEPNLTEGEKEFIQASLQAALAHLKGFEEVLKDQDVEVHIVKTNNLYKFAESIIKNPEDKAYQNFKERYEKKGVESNSLTIGIIQGNKLIFHIAICEDTFTRGKDDFADFLSTFIHECCHVVASYAKKEQIQAEDYVIDELDHEIEVTQLHIKVLIDLANFLKNKEGKENLAKNIPIKIQNKLLTLCGLQIEKLLKELKTDFKEDEKALIDTVDEFANLNFKDFDKIAAGHTLVTAKSTNIRADIDKVLASLPTIKRKPAEERTKLLAAAIGIINGNKITIIRFIDEALFKNGYAQAFVGILHERVRTHIYLSNFKQGIVLNPFEEDLEVAKSTLEKLEFFINDNGKVYKGDYGALKTALKKELEFLKEKIKHLDKKVKEIIEKKEQQDGTNPNDPNHQGHIMLHHSGKHALNRKVDQSRFTVAARRMKFRHAS